MSVILQPVINSRWRSRRCLRFSIPQFAQIVMRPPAPPKMGGSTYPGNNVECGCFRRGHDCRSFFAFNPAATTLHKLWHHFLAFATRSIEIPNHAVRLMIVVTGRSNFSAMVCSGVCAFTSAINSRSSCIDHTKRERDFLAMVWAPGALKRGRGGRAIPMGGPVCIN